MRAEVRTPDSRCFAQPFRASAGRTSHEVSCGARVHARSGDFLGERCGSAVTPRETTLGTVALSARLSADARSRRPTTGDGVQPPQLLEGVLVTARRPRQLAAVYRTKCAVAMHSG